MWKAGTWPVLHACANHAHDSGGATSRHLPNLTSNRHLRAVNSSTGFSVTTWDGGNEGRRLLSWRRAARCRPSAFHNLIMTGFWLVPRSALFLLIVMEGPVCFLGPVLGDWILPFTIAFMHGGWTEVLRIPISERIFADVPAFIEPQSDIFRIVNVGRFVLGLTTLVLSLLATKRWWEHLVINKYKWMTREEVEAFYKRDPGI